MKYFNTLALQSLGPGALYQSALNGGIISGTLPETYLPTGIDATKLADGSVTNTELQYINSLTSNAQTQLGGKVDSSVLTTNGDLLTRTGGSPARLGLGTSLQYLRVNSGASALEYATLPGSSGGLYFQALKTTGQTFAAVTWTKITFDTPRVNDMFTEASDVFTCNTAGWYYVTCTIAPWEATSLYLSIYINGSQIGTKSWASEDLRYNISTIVYLALNDTIAIYGDSTAGNSVQAAGDVYFNSLTIASIG